MRSEAQGRLLVVLQFLLLALIASLTGPSFWRGQASLPAWALLAAAVAQGLWALSANPPGNFNIRPTPKPGARLVRSGPYRWIRHPMYSSLLLAGLGATLGVEGALRSSAGAAWLALLAVLWLKARLEERWMDAQHADYRAYRQGTRRFVPGLW